MLKRLKFAGQDIGEERLCRGDAVSLYGLLDKLLVEH